MARVGRLKGRSAFSCEIVARCLGWMPDAIFHIGIGYGHAELEVLSEIWSDAQWFGCEPHPDAYENLKDTYPGKLYEVAVTDRIGSAFLYQKKRHLDSSTLFPGDDWDLRSHLEVATTTLDSLFPSSEGFPRINGPDTKVLLWLDNEGCELLTLQGGEEFMKGVDMINIEQTFNTPNEQWGSPIDVHNWLADRDFFIQWIHTLRIHAGQADFIYVRRDLFQEKFACMPHEVMRHRNSRG